MLTKVKAKGGRHETVIVQLKTKQVMTKTHVQRPKTPSCYFTKSPSHFSYTTFNKHAKFYAKSRIFNLNIFFHHMYILYSY